MIKSITTAKIGAKCDTPWREEKCVQTVRHFAQRIVYRYVYEGWRCVNAFSEHISTYIYLVLENWGWTNYRVFDPVTALAVMFDAVVRCFTKFALFGSVSEWVWLEMRWGYGVNINILFVSSLKYHCSVSNSSNSGIRVQCKSKHIS